jgi:hypothetical protein
MSIKEKVAYLEGLAEGMKIEATDNGKLFTAIIDTLSVIAEEIEELNENALDIGEELDAISDDLAEVEDFLLDEDYDFDDDDFDFDFDEDDDYDDYDDDDDDESDGHTCDLCGRDDEDDVEFTIDINCPQCNTEIELTEDDIANESVTCKSCGKNIELEIEEVDTEDNHNNED